MEKEMLETKKIESKWQNYWEKNKTFEVKNGEDKEHYYVLVEFPYPSGSGLHVGHVRSYTAQDAIARMKRMQGYNVLYPMGWDAFGAPAEQYAIKNHIHPKDAVKENIKTFKGQMKSLGFSFDWSREFSTTDPDYYKWTQWQFLQFYKHGMAYKDTIPVNWCPTCKSVLSNEDSAGGVCERCGSKVEQREKSQWMLRMSDYAEDLLEGLKDTNFAERVKLGQINWIGKSEGVEVNIDIVGGGSFSIFTTCIETIYGITFFVIAPDGKLIKELMPRVKNKKEVEAYIKETSLKSDMDRTELNKGKTGCLIEGIKAINPVNGKECPVFLGDFVLGNYGTGAVMAVPSHDQRDFEYAQVHDIEMVQVIEEVTGDKKENEISKKSIVAIVYDEKEDKYLTINWHNLGGRLFVGGTIKDDETPLECALREIKEETGYSDLELIRTLPQINHHYYAYNKDKYFNIECTGLLFKLKSLKREEQNLDEDEKFTVEWMNKDDILEEVKDELHYKNFNNAINPIAFEKHDYLGKGCKLINSEEFTGMVVEDAKEAITKKLEDMGKAKRVCNYKMRDWIFSRQRFWGEPIPMINCPKCGWVPMNEEDLPLELPDVAEYEPTEDGESPLAKITDWVNCKCPKCGIDAKRETDTMPNWAGSSWYFLRFMDPHNDKEFVGMDAMKYWKRVDWYNGGMEHTARHLLYARFWVQMLYNFKLVPYKEMIWTRVSHGMILGSNNEKMSKSKGNVINPDDVVKEYGADTLRIYELFIGDYQMDASWSTDSLKGCRRFLDRIIRLGGKLNDKSGYTDEILVNKTIKKIETDLTTLKYNTAVSSLMIMLNEYEKYPNGITKDDYRVLLVLLNPIAPHITEELNEVYELGKPICESDWPKYDDSKTVEEEKEIAVQVNGKVRATIKVNINDSEEEMKEKALNEENVIRHTENKEIVKVIVIKGKIINIVVK